MSRHATINEKGREVIFMVPFLVYWGSILINIAWIILSAGFSVWYLANKENGNLWAFALFNVLAVIYLGIIYAIYNTWNFDVKLYSSLFIGIIVILLALTVLQAILGREPKVATAS